MWHRRLVFDGNENVGLFLAVVVKLAYASEFTQGLVKTQIWGEDEEGNGVQIYGDRRTLDGECTMQYI